MLPPREGTSREILPAGERADVWRRVGTRQKDSARHPTAIFARESTPSDVLTPTTGGG